jgi:hypothetical protein
MAAKYQFSDGPTEKKYSPTYSLAPSSLVARTTAM